MDSIAPWTWVFLEALLLLHLQLPGTSGLREMLMRAPSAVLAGASMRLQCEYDLESAALYSIKWYRDDQEFYRYVPKEDPPRRTFRVDPPLDVDLSASGAHVVRILRTTLAQSGVYKCEVTADAPLFHTDIRSAHVTVIQVDQGGVHLRPVDTPVDTAQYDSRQPVAVCAGPPAYPSSNITWFVNSNQIPANSPMISSVVEKKDPESGLSMTRSKLLAGALGISGGDIVTNTVLVRCEATVLDAYRDVAELHIEPPSLPIVPPVGPITGPTAPLGLSDSSQYSNGVSINFALFNSLIAIGLSMLSCLTNL